jgi:hypothetical protein
MNLNELSLSLRRLYWLTASYGLLGFVSYFWLQGVRPALGFAIGSLGSLGNLWLFNWLSRAIAPGPRTRRPWEAGAFVGRYLVLFLVGYATVKSLDVNPLPVVLGLFASTAAVLTALVVELIENLIGRRTTH